MADLVESLNQLISTNPLLGIFVTSMIGNIIPFFPVPYLLFVVFVASTDTGLSLIPVATIAAWAPLSENSQATPLDTEPAEPSLVARPSLTRSENCLGEAPSLLPSHSPHCLYRTTSSSSRSV